MRLWLLLLVIPINALAFEPTVEREDVLRNLLKHDCGACHGITLKGGLGPPLLAESLKEKSDDYLLKTIRDGRTGTAMPPWKPFLSREETLWLIQNLLRK